MTTVLERLAEYLDEHPDERHVLSDASGALDVSESLKVARYRLDAYDTMLSKALKDTVLPEVFV